MIAKDQCFNVKGEQHRGNDEAYQIRTSCRPLQRRTTSDLHLAFEYPIWLWMFLS